MRRLSWISLIIVKSWMMIFKVDLAFNSFGFNFVKIQYPRKKKSGKRFLLWQTNTDIIIYRIFWTAWNGLNRSVFSITGITQILCVKWCTHTFCRQFICDYKRRLGPILLWKFCRFLQYTSFSFRSLIVLPGNIMLSETWKRPRQSRTVHTCGCTERFLMYKA